MYGALWRRWWLGKEMRREYHHIHHLPIFEFWVNRNQKISKLYSSQYRQHLSPTYVFELEKSEIRKSEKRLLFTLDGEGDGKSAVFAVPNYFLEYREHFLPNFFLTDEKQEKLAKALAGQDRKTGGQNFQCRFWNKVKKRNHQFFFHKKVWATGITYVFQNFLGGGTHWKKNPKLIASLCAGI